MVLEIKQRREAETLGSSDVYESLAKSHCLYATPKLYLETPRRDTGLPRVLLEPELSMAVGL